jgi:hypothetical protein
MHAVIIIAAMTAIFAAHVVMMVELRPRGGDSADDGEVETLGENL